MEDLCWSYAPLAYGLNNFSGVHPDLWQHVTADLPSALAGLAGGTLTGVLLFLLLLRRNDRRYFTPTCGSRDHLHLCRRTAGGARVFVCGPPYHHTCGDDTHPHVHAMTTSGDPAFLCMTEDVERRYRQIAIRHRLRAKGDTP